MSAPVKAEISEDGVSVMVTFPFHPARVKKVKNIATHRFVGKDKAEGPGWRLNLDMTEMRNLREQFGDELQIGPELRRWAKRVVERERNLTDLSDANDAKLEVLHPRFAKWLRPYQRADVRFQAQTNVINTNQPRTGKTPTTIGGILEAGMEWGCHLVFAPVQALDEVWEYGIYQAYIRQFTNARLPKKEILEDWGYEDYKAVFDKKEADMPTVLTGSTPGERKEAIEEAVELYEDERAFWLVINPYFGRVKKFPYLGKKRLTPAQVKKLKPAQMDKLEYRQELMYPELADIEWDTVTIDEFHLMGLSNPNTDGAQGMNLIANETEPQRRYALSGTPMGGKPIKLWGALHFVDPANFTSRWNWARQWLVVKKSDHGEADRHHYSIESIKPGLEIDFYEHLKPYLVRRTQKEALPGLPDKNRINVWCPMTPRQQEQYRTFERDAEWRISDREEDGRLSATSILAEWTRLKQFADAFCEVKKTGKESAEGIPELIVKQTKDSGKLDMLIEKLQECNVIGTSKADDDELECAVVGSQFNPMADMLAEALAEKVPTARMYAGDTERNKAIRKAFQTQTMQRYKGEIIPPPRIVVMTLKMGTAITLDRAKTVHLLDEDWVPDTQEQFEDRITPTNEEVAAQRADTGIYYYRSRMTIEEYIRRLVADKALNNKTILDLRRRIQKQLAEEEARERAPGTVRYSAPAYLVLLNTAEENFNGS